MKEGQFFSVPERPDDLASLWRRSAPLDAAALPPWLTIDDVANYRRVAPRRRDAVTPADRAQLAVEIDELAEAGLIFDDGSSDAAFPEVIIEAPRVEDVWAIGLYSGPSPVNLAPHEGASNPILTRDDVLDVPASFVADPFMVARDGRFHLFFEVMNWKSGKGEIGWAESHDGLAWTYQKIVLSEPFHLSFPQVFQWNGRVFMTPESHQAGEVRLYEAVRFPDEWRFVGRLLEGEYLADPVVFRHEDMWFAFVDGSADQQHHTLLLSTAEELSGPWTIHPKSPVIAGDPRHARPAGRVVSWEGRLLRFAQSCVPEYGTDVRCFEVTQLSCTEYRERRFADGVVIGPTGVGWNADGMHHVDPHRRADGSWIAYVDGWRRIDPTLGEVS